MSVENTKTPLIRFLEENPDIETIEVVLT